MLIDCALLQPERGLCALASCALPLPSKRFKWCADHKDWFGKNHWWTWARPAAITRDGKCVRCGSTKRMEVNHIVPRNGAGYDSGCGHHQAGLETLCHWCHLQVTAQQRRDLRPSKAERKLQAWKEAQHD